MPSKSNELWNQIKQDYELPKSVTPGAIYTAMLDMFRQIIDQNKKVDPNEESRNITNNLDESNQIDEINDSLEVQQHVSPKNIVKFQVNLSITVWNRIKPERQIYNRMWDNHHRQLDRKYLVLPKGVWTYCLSQAIARQKKGIPCHWTFKRGKVYPDGSKYITVAGSCTICNAKLNGFLRAKPDTPTKFVRLMMEVENIDYSIHGKSIEQKNVKIHGNITRALCEKDQPATAITRNMLCESVGLFETPKERIATPNAIRCSQYRTRKQDHLNDCPLKALQILKLSYYDKWIRAIGLDPFYAIYANTDQEILYKLHKMKSKYTSVSCDATGGVARKIVREDGERSQQILLYTFIINMNGHQMPVFSMLSEVHNMNFVAFYFGEFVRIFGDIPSVFKCDISLVLLNAAARSFGNCANIDEYVDWLFGMHKNSNLSGCRKPTCYIRIDVAHFVKNVTSCDALKTKPAEERQFYIRSLCLLIKCTSLTQAERISRAILVVAKSKNKGTQITSFHNL